MKKLLALIGTILLVILNIVQIRLNSNEKTNTLSASIASADNFAGGNCIRD